MWPDILINVRPTMLRMLGVVTRRVLVWARHRPGQVVPVGCQECDPVLSLLFYMFYMIDRFLSHVAYDVFEMIALRDDSVDFVV